MSEALPIPRIYPYEMLIPNLGLYLDRPSVSIPKGGMSACKNVRVKNGRVSNFNMGWEPFFDIQLNGQVLMIDQFFTREGSQVLIFGTRYDLYRFDSTGEEALFITPSYNVGTVTVIDTDTTVEGVGGMLWDTAKAVGSGNNAEPGYEIAFGDNAENDPAATWYEIDSVTDDDTLELTTGHVGGVAGVAYTIRQKFTGDNLDIWCGETFPDAQENDEDTWFATNNIYAEMVKWNGNDDFCSWYDPGFTCRFMTLYKNMMLYGDILDSSGERRNANIINSAIAYPENVTTDEASEFASSDGMDSLLGLYPLGDVMVAYHERSVNLIQYVGVPLNFVIRTAVSGIGAMSGRGIMDFGDFHEFIAYDSCYNFDGVAITDVGTHVFREALRTIDPNRPDKLLAHIDEEQGDVHWVIPLTTDDAGEDGGPLSAYTSHYLEEVGSKNPTPITFRDLPATAMGFFERATTLRFDDLPLGFDQYQFAFNDRYFAAAFPFNIFGDEDGYIYILGTTDHQDDGDIESYARFGRLALGDGKWKGMVKRIEPFATKQAGADYDLGVLLWIADQMEGDLSLAKQMDYDLAHVEKRYVVPRKIGRYGEVEFATTGTNRTWEVAGFRMEMVLAGER